MTGQRIAELGKFLDGARSLNGDLAVLRQRIERLKNHEQFCVSFKKDGLLPQVDIPLGDETVAQIRAALLSEAESQLSAREAEFSALSIPGA